MTPTCPPGYTCTFTPQPVPHPFVGPWWEGVWGIVGGLTAVVFVGIALCMMVYWVAQVRQHRQSVRAQRDSNLRKVTENREVRAQQLAMEEQLTMQVDAAKGNVEILKLIQRQAS